MSILLTIIAVIIIFSALVLIHEYGHFVAARRAGIRVLEFGIGFPPRLFKKKIGETLYTVNAIPFGGFVKLYGEDATDPEIIKDKESYAHKSPWVRTKVVVAGVFMNFILAVVLLTGGFIFGIEPLIITQNDLFESVSQGIVETMPGVFVEEVDKNALASGIEEGDQILAINGMSIKEAAQLAVFEKEGAVKDVDLLVRSKRTKEQKNIHLPLIDPKGNLGVDLTLYTQFPRLSVLAVKPESASARAGLRSGDILLELNGQQIYYQSDFDAIVHEASTVEVGVLRDAMPVTIAVNFPDAQRVIIADVFIGSPAEKAGFRKGDVVVSINGTSVQTPESVSALIRSKPTDDLVYSIRREGKELSIRAKPGQDSRLGIALAMATSFQNSELSLYESSILTSITEIKKVRLPPWSAFIQSISESFRLTELTVQAFGRTLKSIFSQFSVPADIGGPVQIAYYTHTFIQEGFFALLRFTALLSLSLAVINVLPIPALDGGRLLFIVIEVLFKKRVNARFEALVHAFGFVLLLLLIALVTYSDITKLF